MQSIFHRVQRKDGLTRWSLQSNSYKFEKYHIDIFMVCCLSLVDN